MGKNRDRNQYIKDYPELHKWINECVVCHTKGYDPKIELKEEKIAVNNLKSILPPLEVNDLGMCPICEKLLERKGMHNE